MDNIILSGMLKEFGVRHGINEAIDRKFEKFVNYCLLKPDHYDSFEFDKVDTGSCVGVDGVAISVGGVIVDEMEDLELMTKGQFEVRFIFTQAKTSPKLDLGEILKFLSTVKIFFGKDETHVPEQLQKAYQLKRHIYERASAKLRALPSAELYFVYSGKRMGGAETIERQIESALADLRGMAYVLSRVQFELLDGDAIARLYREAQNEVRAEISFQRHVALPPMRGAKSAYLGAVKCTDYVRIIKKENGDLNKALFFENVRDFLGTKNQVNEEIARTINDSEERDRFAILNNGVTIVAKGVTPSGDIFQLSQFQIVNGCQTSNVLFRNESALTSDMYLTVKIVETSDLDLSGQVISTTNSQTVVTKEAFATIRPYHRLIEDFFNAMRQKGFTYYYERRPHQYDDSHDIKQQHIVSAPSLIKSFVSVVMEQPHKVHYYYGTLLSEYNQNRDSELFAQDDNPALYFIAHDIVFRTRVAAGADPELKEWSFHLALLIKRHLLPELKKSLPRNDGQFLAMLARIEANYSIHFQNAAAFLRGQGLKRNDNRIAGVTEKLVSEFERTPRAKNTVDPVVASAAAKIELKDGKYVGTLLATDVRAKRATVNYGPFEIVGNLTGEYGALKVGARVFVTVKDKVVTISQFT